MSILPSNATEASYIRYQIAYELAQLCPPALGNEIVLTGSASHGVSDEYSDIEQVFYVDTVPTVAEREKWLQSVGATEVVFDAEPIEDASIWATFHFRGIWVEAGWQTIDAHEKNLQTALSGNVTDHWLLMLAPHPATLCRLHCVPLDIRSPPQLTAHAVSLRSVGLLSKWQQELAQYPDSLQRRLIANVTELWMFPNIVATRWSLIQRGERLALAERLVRDTCNVLRILFALNREWEPDWKWLSVVTDRLTIKPERLVERINEIFAVPPSYQSVAALMQLMLDTLALVPAEYDVGRAMKVLRESYSA